MAEVEHVHPNEVLKIYNFFESLETGDIYYDLDVGRLKIKTEPNPYHKNKCDFVMLDSGLHAIQSRHHSLGVYPYKLTVKFWKSVENIEAGKVYRHKIHTSVFMKTDEPYFVRLDTGEIISENLFIKKFYQEAIDPRFIPVD